MKLLKTTVNHKQLQEYGIAVQKATSTIWAEQNLPQAEQQSICEVAHVYSVDPTTLQCWLAGIPTWGEAWEGQQAMTAAQEQILVCDKTQDEPSQVSNREQVEWHWL